jgi:hypothetical protein
MSRAQRRKPADGKDDLVLRRLQALEAISALERGGLSAEIAHAFRATVDEVFAAGKQQGMRAILGDLGEGVRDLPVAARIALRERLLEQGLPTFDHDESKRLRAVDAILRRGKVRNADEYALLLERVEEIYSAPDRSDQVEVMNGLLRDFHRNG